MRGELSTYDDSDDGYISKNALEDIWGRSQIHLDINERDTRLKIHELVRLPNN